jgi:hypothetical protein
MPGYTYWTAWERVPLEIEADEVLPLIWNRRLYLFWQVVTEKENNGQKQKLLRAAWSEYRQNKWSSRQISSVDAALPLDVDHYRMDWLIRWDELTIYFATNPLPMCLTGPHLDSYGMLTQGTSQTAAKSIPLGRMTFSNPQGLVQANLGPNLSIIYDEGFTAAASTDGLRFDELGCGNTTIEVLGQLPDGAARLYAPGTRPYSLDDPFFMQDGRRAYLVFPHTVYSPTVHHLGDRDKATPYLPGLDPKFKQFDPREDLGMPLARMAGPRGDANPWLAGSASLAALTMERAASATMTTMSGPVPIRFGGSALETSVQKNIGVFDNAIFKPGALLPRNLSAAFRFETFFHPYTGEFQRRLNRFGTPGLLAIDSQRPSGLPFVASFNAPKPAVETPYPPHDVDFTVGGAYSLYNWELFFHVPLLLATRLGQNGRYEEAMTWFHTIFDPTTSATTEPSPERFWKVQPFRDTPAVRLDDMLKALHAGDASVIAQWQELERHPFQPHRVARLRRIAYQKTVVMKYVANLVAWGDALFRRDTLESINEATQVYVLAAALMGHKPERVPSRGRAAAQTYAQLRPGLDQLGQAMACFENDFPFTGRATPLAGDATGESAALLGIGRVFYFCIPQNEKLLECWDTIADRLFKIRHCMNIEGVIRQLPLFEPPIDPALLVKAAAQGVDLSSVLSDLSAPLPYYRFSTLFARAMEMTAELRSLGAGLLAALEKRDAESLANLRASHETEMLTLAR